MRLQLLLCFFLRILEVGSVRNSPKASSHERRVLPKTTAVPSSKASPAAKSVTPFNPASATQAKVSLHSKNTRGTPLVPKIGSFHESTSEKPYVAKSKNTGPKLPEPPPALSQKPPTRLGSSRSAPVRIIGKPASDSIFPPTKISKKSSKQGPKPQSRQQQRLGSGLLNKHAELTIARHIKPTAEGKKLGKGGKDSRKGILPNFQRVSRKDWGSITHTVKPNNHRRKSKASSGRDKNLITDRHVPKKSPISKRKATWSSISSKTKDYLKTSKASKNGKLLLKSAKSNSIRKVKHLRQGREKIICRRGGENSECEDGDKKSEQKARSQSTGSGSGSHGSSQSSGAYYAPPTPDRDSNVFLQSNEHGPSYILPNPEIFRIRTRRARYEPADPEIKAEKLRQARKMREDRGVVFQQGEFSKDRKPPKSDEPDDKGKPIYLLPTAKSSPYGPYHPIEDSSGILRHPEEQNPPIQFQDNPDSPRYMPGFRGYVNHRNPFDRSHIREVGGKDEHGKRFRAVMAVYDPIGLPQHAAHVMQFLRYNPKQAFLPSHGPGEQNRSFLIGAGHLPGTHKDEKPLNSQNPGDEWDPSVAPTLEAESRREAVLSNAAHGAARVQAHDSGQERPIVGLSVMNAERLKFDWGDNKWGSSHNLPIAEKDRITHQLTNGNLRPLPPPEEPQSQTRKSRARNSGLTLREPSSRSSRGQKRKNPDFYYGSDSEMEDNLRELQLTNRPRPGEGTSRLPPEPSGSQESSESQELSGSQESSDSSKPSKPAGKRRNLRRDLSSSAPFPPLPPPKAVMTHRHPLMQSAPARGMGTAAAAA